MSFVYVLQSELDKNIYIGKTENIEKRLEEHNKGYVISTRNRRPFKLVAYFRLSDRSKADEFENYLKTGSGRAFLKKHFF